MTDEQATDFALEAIHSQGSPVFVRDPARPDELVRDAPAVDFTARAGDVLLAVEHTQGEPYEGFLADWNLAHTRLGPVRELLAGRLPEDSSFNISFSPASPTVSPRPTLGLSPSGSPRRRRRSARPEHGRTSR